MVIRSPFQIPIPIPKPFHLAVMETFDQYGMDNVALEEDGSGKQLTFGDLKRQSCEIAYSLRDRYGFSKGDVLLTFSENRIEFPSIVFGVSAIGGITSGANPLYTFQELAKQIENSEAKFILTTPIFLPKVQKAVDSLRGSTSLQIRTIFVIDGTTASTTSNNKTRILPFSDLCNSTSSNSTFPYTHINPKEDPVLLPYSSGTTGLPKGVVLTHHNLQCFLFGRQSLGTFGTIDRGDTAILFLPFFHMAGFMGLILTLHNGSTGIIMRQFDSRRYVEAVQRYKVSTVYAVPSVLVFLAKDPSIDQYDLSSVKTVAFGAAPAGKELVEALAKRFPKLENVRQGYGLTESGGLATLTPRIPLSQYPLGSCGVPTPFTELKVMSIDGKCQELGPLNQGEIWLRGPNIMKGYYKNHKSTQETLDKDEWLHTGDIGYYDFFGHVYVVDRLKELIKYKSYQVAPAELEDTLLKHHAVQEVAVVGIPDKDPDIGELPRAYVVLNQGYPPTEETALSIKATVSQHLAPFKHLRGGVVFVRQIPKGGTGKVLRRVVKELSGKVYGIDKEGHRAKL